jgi:hypothetical protein
MPVGVCIYSNHEGSATIWTQRAIIRRSKRVRRACWSVMAAFGGRLEGDLTFCSGRLLPARTASGGKRQRSRCFRATHTLAVTGARRWTSAPATTSTAISAPMAGSRSRSLTSLISVGALPSASTRSCSKRKSGAGAAPMAWRPLFRRDCGPVTRSMPTSLRGADVAITHHRCNRSCYGVGSVHILSPIKVALP